MTPREDKKNCSSSPANAFNPEYIKTLEAREDSPLAAIEAETRGPWQVVQMPPGGGGDDDGGGGRPDPEPERWAVLREWEKPGEDKPSGTFLYREHALLWAAALEVAEYAAVWLSHSDA